MCICDKIFPCVCFQMYNLERKGANGQLYGQQSKINLKLNVLVSR